MKFQYLTIAIVCLLFTMGCTDTDKNAAVSSPSPNSNINSEPLPQNISSNASENINTSAPINSEQSKSPKISADTLRNQIDAAYDANVARDIRDKVLQEIPSRIEEFLVTKESVSDPFEELNTFFHGNLIFHENPNENIRFVQLIAPQDLTGKVERYTLWSYQWENDTVTFQKLFAQNSMIYREHRILGEKNEQNLVIVGNSNLYQPVPAFISTWKRQNKQWIPDDRAIQTLKSQKFSVGIIGNVATIETKGTKDSASTVIDIRFVHDNEIQTSFGEVIEMYKWKDGSVQLKTPTQ